MESALISTSEKYAAYLQKNSALKNKSLNDIEVAISKYEEMNSFVEKNHSTYHTFLDSKLPELSKFSKDLSDLFHCIDNLEDLVKKVETDVVATEAAVNKAELDLKININLPATFKPLLIMKEAPYFPARDGDTEFSAPDLKFDSLKYFD